MAEDNKMKDLDQLVAQAKLEALKDKNKKGEFTKTDLKTKLSSAVGVEDKTEGPKKLPKIRTYSYDAQKAIEDSNASIARLKVSQDKQKRTGQKIGGKSIFAFIALMLIVIGVVAVGMVYMNREVAEPVPVIVERTTIIPFDEIIESGNDTLEGLFGQVALSDGITYLLNENISIDNLREEYLGSIPGIVARNLSGEFMYGTFSTAGNHTPFLILKSEYKFAFPGMQQWEEKLGEDLSEILALNIEQNDIFLDVPNQNFIIRTDGVVSYGIHRDGYIVVSGNVSVIENILSEL